jgi:esterase/lipase
MLSEEDVNFYYSFRYLIDIVAQRNSKLTELSDIHSPVFILCGTEDRNVYPQVAEEFFKLLKSGEKKILKLECNHWFYDAIFYNQSDEYSEKDRLNFVNQVITWMNSISEKDRFTM